MKMKRVRYELLTVTWTEQDPHPKGISLESTDSREIDWILTGLKQLIPSVYEVAYEAKLFSGETWNCFLRLVKGADFSKMELSPRYVYWWILKQLCQRGWEPFHDSNNGRTCSLRYTIEFE